MDGCIDFPIDIVYLWVDGNDPAWRAKKDKFLRQSGILNPEVKSDARFRDNDELKYSLRSVQQFAPWIRRIFIVTDGQTPKWLDTKHPKISIIDHKLIMPAEILPTFNSYVIENYLDKIPGLSEHFLYANDDCMFGRAHTPDDFFDAKGTPVNVVKLRGNMKIWSDADFKASVAKKAGIYGKNLILARKLVYDQTGRKYFCNPSHNLEPLRKSYFAETKKIFSEEFPKAARSKFRGYPNLTWFAHIIYNNALGRNKLILNKTSGNMPEAYEPGDFAGPNKKSLRRLAKSLFLKPKYFTMDGTDISREIIKKHPFLFCINDSERSNGKTLRRNGKFLAHYFPTKSEFEI
jgi:hypothetical protein